MGLFDNHFPYTNFQNLNLDQIADSIGTCKSNAAAATAAAEDAEEFASAASEAKEDAEQAKEDAEAAAAALANGSPIVVTLASDMTDTDLIYLYMGSEAGYNFGEWYYWDGDSWESGGTYGGGVITSSARSLLIYILQHAAYDQTGMNAYINQLDNVLQAGQSTYYAVTNTLTNVTSSNSDIIALAGGAYTAALTADQDYTLDTVTVTMGGVDITASVYSAGVISIPVVTGDIVITATATVSMPYNMNVLFSDITLTSGYINDSGETAELSDNEFYATPIPAVGFCMITNGGNVYSVTNNQSLRIAEYNANNEFLARSYALGTTNAPVKFIFGSNSPTFIKPGFSNAATVESSADRFVFMNVLDTTLCTLSGYSIDSNGDPVASAGAAISDFLPINDGYMVCKLNNNSDSALMVFYDSDKSFLLRIPVTNGSGYNGAAVAIPNGAAYVRFRVNESPNDVTYISYVK